MTVDWQRWVLDDPDGETYTFPFNPNRMDTPHRMDNLTPTARSWNAPNEAQVDHGVARVIQGKRIPLEWSFSGVLRTQAHYRALVRFHHLRKRINVTDHFGRTWEVLIQGIEWQERRPSAHADWRFAYTVNCLLYRRVS
jgi:hypothetical protein